MGAADDPAEEVAFCGEACGYQEEAGEIVVPVVVAEGGLAFGEGNEGMDGLIVRHGGPLDEEERTAVFWNWVSGESPEFWGIRCEF